MKILIAIIVCVSLILTAGCGDNSIEFTYSGLEGGWRWMTTLDSLGNLVDSYDISHTSKFLNIDLKRGTYAIYINDSLSMYGFILTGSVLLPECEQKADILMLQGFDDYFLYESTTDSLILSEYNSNYHTYRYARLLPF